MATKKKKEESIDGQVGQDSGPRTTMTKAELKSYLMAIRDKMIEESTPAIYVASAMNDVLCQGSIYDILTKENKEIARDIWLRLKQAGLQVRDPGLLFSASDVS